MAIWDQSWVINSINFCRKWKWFDEKIYGKSTSIEDFLRNPAEVLRDTTPPFVFFNVKPISVINLRLGYIPYDSNNPVPCCWSVPMGDRKYIWKGNKYVIADVRLCNDWWTKFCNAMFYFQFVLSFWHTCIPIPYICFNFRIGKYRYFQFGLGWGGQINVDSRGYDAVLCAKLRYVNQVTSDENILNPTDVVGYYEGTI